MAPDALKLRQGGFELSILPQPLKKMGLEPGRTTPAVGTSLSISGVCIFMTQVIWGGWGGGG